jgi:hypothetical protein
MVGAVLVVLAVLAEICRILQQSGKQGLVPEEISQPLLTNKKQGNLE